MTAAFAALSLTRIHELEEAGNRHAAALHHWKLHPEQPLLALNLMTVVLLVVGSSTTALAGFAANEALSTVVLTLLLMLGVLLPMHAASTSLGIRQADQRALLTARFLTLHDVALRPLLAILAFIQRILSREEQDPEEAAREDIDEILESAREEGSLDADEYRILKNIMHFSDVLVADVMTPRTVIFGFNADTPIANAVKIPEIRQYSRFPIWEQDSPDATIAYVLTKDVLWSMVSGQGERTLRDVAREVYMIPENLSLDSVLEQFLKRREHLFVAVDEYGGVEGIITMEDVLETILGTEIVDENDRVTDLRELAKQQRERRLTARRDKE